jgi:hypothetical protein
MLNYGNNTKISSKNIIKNMTFWNEVEMKSKWSNRLFYFHSNNSQNEK